METKVDVGASPDLGLNPALAVRLSSRVSPLAPINPTRLPFWCISGQLCCTWVSRPEGFVLEAASADPYLSRADVHAVTFQWGFAEWIGETHLN